MNKKMKQISFSIIMFLNICSFSFAQSPKMIDVGGYKLEVYLQGTGSPTVILEAGMTDDYSTWLTVIPYITQFTSVVAYSRAGYGKSEKRTTPQTFDQVISDLNKMLNSLDEVKPPYVFVGHSLGGIIARKYISRFENEVSGLVIVDGAHENQANQWEAQDPKGWAKHFKDENENYWPKQPKVCQEEYAMFKKLQAQKADKSIKLPNIPIVVITSTALGEYDFWTPERKNIWRELQSEWFENAKNGMHIVTNKSGHYIHQTEPELVVNAIKYVVNYVRTDSTNKKD